MPSATNCWPSASTSTLWITPSGDLNTTLILLNGAVHRRWQAGALEDRAARQHVEQRLLHLIRHIGVADVDIETGRRLGADAGAQCSGICLCPRRDAGEGYLYILPAAHCWALAPRDDWDRLVSPAW